MSQWRELGITVLVALSVYGPCRGEGDTSPDRGLSLSGIQSLAGGIAKDRYVAMVACSPPEGIPSTAEGERRGVAVTDVAWSADDPQQTIYSRKVRIAGTFRIVRSYHQKPPPGGAVDATYVLDSSWGGKANDYDRLKALVRPGTARSQDGRIYSPEELLVVGRPDDKTLLEGRFAYIGVGMNRFAAEFVNYHLTHSYMNIPEEDARKLTRQENPLLVFTGLARLRELRGCKAGDWGNAINSVAIENVKDVGLAFVYEYFPDYQASPRAVSDNLVLFLQKGDRARQEKILVIIIASLKDGWNGSQRMLAGQEGLVDALKRYAEMRAGLSEWHPVTEKYMELRRHIRDIPQRDRAGGGDR
ncbi:MAG TPA: hypothetical protein PKG77_24055 [Phycisphaerae bacterium]|nr:hypothetical protein [Phycisphaerae bacterium]HQL75596.1 hypothetical protein [Phycisphaerae bacterium]